MQSSRGCYNGSFLGNMVHTNNLQLPTIPSLYFSSSSTRSPHSSTTIKPLDSSHPRPQHISISIQPMHKVKCKGARVTTVQGRAVLRQYLHVHEITRFLNLAVAMSANLCCVTNPYLDGGKVHLLGSLVARCHLIFLIVVL